jgi:predicted nucleic-acid-binding Zn-ribbon protein
MINKLKCSKCGNDKKFHRDVSIQAKLKINNKGEDLKTVLRREVRENNFIIKQ